MPIKKLTLQKSKQMPLVHGRIPEELYNWLQTHLQEAGFANSGDYLRSLIRADRERVQREKQKMTA
jgi:Arc/MetJ-type ribon-helix-helix transcriptional regulator